MSQDGPRVVPGWSQVASRWSQVVPGSPGVQEGDEGRAASQGASGLKDGSRQADGESPMDLAARNSPGSAGVSGVWYRALYYLPCLPCPVYPPSTLPGVHHPAVHHPAAHTPVSAGYAQYGSELLGDTSGPVPAPEPGPAGGPLRRSPTLPSEPPLSWEAWLPCPRSLSCPGSPTLP